MFSPSIFEAIKDTPIDHRGELQITDAIRLLHERRTNSRHPASSNRERYDIAILESTETFVEFAPAIRKGEKLRSAEEWGKIIQTHTTRALVAGNPSDGYNGRTISIIKTFANAVIYDGPKMRSFLRTRPVPFSNLAEFLTDVSQNGYYGGMRLVKAAIKRFASYCEARNIQPGTGILDTLIRIPRQIGLAGRARSEATFRALCAFLILKLRSACFPVTRCQLRLPSWNCGWSAGSRSPVYEGLSSMDFTKNIWPIWADILKGLLPIACHRCSSRIRLIWPKVPKSSTTIFDEDTTPESRGS